MKQDSNSGLYPHGTVSHVNRRPHEEDLMKLSSFMGKIPKHHALLPVGKLYHEIKHGYLRTFG